MERLFLIVPTAFIVLVVLFVLILVLAGRSDRRDARSLVDLAAARGFKFVLSYPMARQELLDIVEPTRFVRTAANRGGGRNEFGPLIRGEAEGYSFQYFRHVHRYRTRGRPARSGETDRRPTTTWLLALHSAHCLETPPVWFKQASLGDELFTMAGLKRVKLDRPEMDGRFHFFCDDRSFVKRFACPEVLECCEALLPGEMVCADRQLLVLASPVFIGADGLIRRLERQASFRRFLEGHRFR